MDLLINLGYLREYEDSVPFVFELPEQPCHHLELAAVVLNQPGLWQLQEQRIANPLCHSGQVWHLKSARPTYRLLSLLVCYITKII